jgi:hypothetical protein
MARSGKVLKRRLYASAEVVSANLIFLIMVTCHKDLRSLLKWQWSLDWDLNVLMPGQGGRNGLNFKTHCISQTYS